MKAVDLNADLGELPGESGRALDKAILAQVTSASVACGGHAGDAETMRATFEAAAEAGVQLGAHPSYPDREGFGRRSLSMSAAELERTLYDQVGAAVEIAGTAGVALRHLKPHGALYHDAKRGEAAWVLAGCARAYGLAVYGPPTGMLYRAAISEGVRYVGEGFADRAYRDGDLVPRGEPGAVIEDEAAQAEQVLRLVTGEMEGDVSGAPIRTICLHSDTPGAASAAARLRASLEAAGLRLAPPAPA